MNSISSFISKYKLFCSLNQQHRKINHSRMDYSVIRQVDKYDGQAIIVGGKEVYEIGNYLGGGASGSVYQATDLLAHDDSMVAIKILNPIGFKLASSSQIKECIVVHKGIFSVIQKIVSFCSNCFVFAAYNLPYQVPE